MTNNHWAWIIILSTLLGSCIDACAGKLTSAHTVAFCLFLFIGVSLLEPRR